MGMESLYQAGLILGFSGITLSLGFIFELAQSRPSLSLGNGELRRKVLQEFVYESQNNLQAIHLARLVAVDSSLKKASGLVFSGTSKQPLPATLSELEAMENEASLRRSVTTLGEQAALMTPLITPIQVPDRLNYVRLNQTNDLSFVRIHIGNQNQFSIAYSMAALILDASGKVIGSIQPNQVYRVSLRPDGIFIEDTPLGDNVLILPDTSDVWSNVVHLNPETNSKVSYQGYLNLIKTNQSIALINYVDLENYLYSVVGSEMYPNWNEQALMAQAIAARSYAVYHRLHRTDHFFDLGATERWQVYSGLHKVTDTTRSAVDKTRGIILVDSKGNVLMSQYAANNDIVKSVFNGKGMSQIDAQKMAQDGKSYITILNHFYPDSTFAQIQSKS